MSILKGGALLEHVLNSIRARAPWRSVARLMVKQAGLHAGMGWTDTLPDLLAPGAVRPAEAKALHGSLLEHLVAGEKSLQFFRADPKELKQFVEHCRSRRKASHELTAHYPWMVDEQVLASIGDVPPKFCDCLETDSGVAIIFMAARSYQKRVELAASDVKPGVFRSYEIESLFGVIRRRRVVYDAIWVPKGSGLAVVAADYPDDATSDFPLDSHVSLQRAIEKFTTSGIEAVDLFGGVAGLYGAPDGEVVELGFVTDDDSVKHLKCRKKGRSLRDDVYHIAGSEEVGDSLTPFKVAVRWHREVSRGIISAPEVLLPGTSRHIFGVSKPIDYAVFRNGLNVRDLNLVVSKLLPHM